MNNRVKDRVRDAFDTIHAEQGLKDRTREYLAQRSGRGGRAHFLAYLSARGYLVPVAACCIALLLGIGGYRVWLVPTSVISIDINPSIELGINRFDRVVSVKGYNEDGERLAAGLRVRFMDYTEAVERILEDEEIARCLARNELLSVVVVESDAEQSVKMISNLNSCLSGHGNAHCHSVDTHVVEAAHRAGLSYGKYWALLRLQELDPDITAEEAAGMTMREIADLLGLLQTDGAVDPNAPGEGPAGAAPDGGICDTPYYENGHHGKEHGHGHGKD